MIINFPSPPKPQPSAATLLILAKLRRAQAAATSPEASR